MTRILLLLDHHENRRCLEEALTARYQVIIPQTDDALDEAFDLGIVDGRALDRLAARVQARKQAEMPAFLPFLLLTARQDVGMATRHLWQSIDDIILMPVERVELQARIENLLKTRRLSREFYQKVVNAAPSSIILLDEKGIVTLWSPSAERMFGWREQEIVGQPLPLTVPGEPLAVQVLWQRAVRGDRIETREMRLTRRDGSTLDVQISVTPMRGVTGLATHVMLIVDDISERKEVERLQSRRLAELEALDKVTATLRRAQTADEAFPVLLNETLDVLGFPAGCIWLYDAGEGRLRAAAARGWFEDLDEAPMSPGEGIAGSVFVTGRAHIAREFQSDARLRPADVEKIPPGWGGACIPIQALDDVVGVLFVACQLPCEVQPDAVRLLEALARMAGVTLQRMIAHEAALRRMSQLEALSRIDQAITGSLGTDMILDTLCAQAVSSLHVDAAGVLLLDPDGITLRYAAGRGFRTSAYGRSRVRLGDGQEGMAALERKPVFCPDLKATVSPLARAALLRDEAFVTYAAVPLVAKGGLKGLLEVFHRAPLRPHREWWSFLEKLALQGAIGVENAQLFEQVQRSNIELSLAYDATIEGWARALELTDRETEGHTRRVAELTLRMARAAGIPNDMLIHIRRGAVLHDIGEMAVPDAILLKPGPLTDAEWEIMRQHPQQAYDLLSPITYLRPALDIPYCHHEKWDGTGYPRGLRGEAIPLAARLFAVVDVWDALNSDRPYRKAWSRQDALAYIRQQSGKHFDPRAVELFLHILEEEGAGISTQ